MNNSYGFKLLREEEVAELNTTAKVFQHNKTKAELFSLTNKDENKVFGVTFRTPPQDSTGIAHIMEHSVLCGSKKFPVKEPFVELIKGSLNTFLNAFTYPDKTCYPVASQNVQDFYNLIDVYLDAVFYPNLTPYTLQQEGWHHELKSPEDDIIYKGVVFNEMKGSYASADRLLAEYSQQCLYPDNTYRHESGGHPRDIPDLTWEQFKSFHETFYHPSNSRIYFYGDDPEEARLELLDACLSNFDYKKTDSAVEIQKPFTKPAKVTHFYQAAASDDGKEKAMFTVNWLLHEADDLELLFALSILDHALIGTSAAPLRKALIDSGLGEDITGGGLEDELQQLTSSIGLKGVAPENLEKAEQLVLESLENLAKNGIDKDTIEASLNTVEFRLRENNTGSYPRGLIFMLRALASWLYDKDPIEAIRFEGPLAQLKKDIKTNPRFFEELIEKHFLHNKHRVTVYLKPDSKLDSVEKAREDEKLKAFKESQSDAEIAQIIENTRVLQERQDRPDPPEELAKIPMLKLQDLDKKRKTIPIEVIKGPHTTTLYHDLFTNGIIYFNIALDFHHLPQELLPYLQLFSQCLTEIGTEKENFVQLSQRIGQKTGGVFSTVYFSGKNNDPAATTKLLLNGKAMVNQTDDMLKIMLDIVQGIQLDNQKRFLQMLMEEKAGIEAALVPHGHSYVNQRLRANISETGWLGENLSGINYLFFLRKLEREVTANWSGVLEKLETIRTALFRKNNAVLNITVDQKNWQTVQDSFSSFANSLPEVHAENQLWNRETTQESEGFIIPGQINFVGKALPLFETGYTFNGSQFVINKFLRTSWLWEKIRVRGGAYGAFCNLNRRNGLFSFVSYRDPNVLKTLQNYDDTANFLKTVALSSDEITKSIIGTIGDFDSYQLPDAKGYSSMVQYLAGDSEQMLQRMRDEVLATTEKDFRDFGDHLQAMKNDGFVVVMGSEPALDAANSEGDNFLKKVKLI